MDRDTYPKHRLNPNISNRYKGKWREKRTFSNYDNLEKKESTTDLEPDGYHRQDESVMYQDKRGKFLNYFILDDDPHKIIRFKAQMGKN